MNKGYVFFYGSLQPDYWNARRFPGLFIGERFRGSVHGRLFWVADPGSYPVAVLSDFYENPPADFPVVEGTWVEIDFDSAEWMQVRAMEYGAGYHARVVRDAESGLRGLAFVYQGRVNEKIEIPSGNWAEAIDKILNPS